MNRHRLRRGGAVASLAEALARMPRSDRHGKALVAIVCIALVATATSVAGCRRATADSARAAETIVRSVDLAIWSMPPQIEVDTFNGNVTVTAGSKPTADVTVGKYATATTMDEASVLLADVDVAVEDQGSARVLVRATRQREPGGGGTSGADVTIAVPGFSAVSVSTSNGVVRVQGLVGPVTVRSSNGSVTVAAGGGTEVHGADIRTSNGSVTVTGPARDVTATTSNAGIQVRGTTGTLALQTSNGAIDAEATAAVVDARTSNAAIYFDGSLADGSHRFATSNGKVTVTLPAATSFRVQVDTSAGKVRTDFAIQPPPQQDARTVSGIVGSNPAAAIRIDTSNADVELRAAAE